MNTVERSELLPAFLSEAGADLDTLRSGVDSLRLPGNARNDDVTLSRLSIVAHRMRGSAGLYGFPQLSKMAALLERVLEARPELHAEGRAAYTTLLGTAVTTLGEGLDAAHSGGTEADLGLRFTGAGGAAQLQAMLRAQPQAFVPRPLANSAAELEDIGFTESASGTDTPAAGLEGTLRSFVREQAEVWEYFAPEVREHLGNLRAQLDAAEPDLDVTFRAAHTIKGSSFMVGLEPLGEFAHRLEDVLGAVRDGLLRIDVPLRDELRRSADVLDGMLRVAEGSDEALQEPLDRQAARLSALASGEAAVPAAEPARAEVPVAAPELATLRIPARQLEGLIDQMGSLVTSRARLGQALTRLDDLQRAMQDSQDRFGRAVRDFEERYLNPDMLRAGDARPERAGPALAENFDELELDTYSDLNILARSITELSADFAEVRRRLDGAVSDLQGEHEDMGKLMRRLRVDVTQTARVPFSQVTARLRRWAREHRDRLELVTRGDDLKVDSATLQRLGEPLLHLLTNAMHHGLGSPETRAAAGKGPIGRVELSAALVGSFLEITVKDDGRGLDYTAIRERALARGLRSAQELNIMEDDDVARLILLPGLSTEQQVSTLAGRGVGMDVVATTTRQLGGELLIRSRPGEGTAFTMRLPTTRRIMDVLQVQVGTVPLAFAVASVRALRELEEHEMRIGEQGFEAPFEGRWVPVIDLRDLWGVNAAGTTFSLVILTTLAGEVAARVDTFGTIEESSVAPTGALLGTLDYLSGTALSAAGDVLPLLEPQGLLRLARRPDTWLRPDGAAERLVARGRLLLVDDSLSVRRVVGRMLERAGFTVDTANDGQEAYERLQLDAAYDVVVSDLEMPRMNGFELLSGLRARPATATLPVVIMTTRAGEKHQRLAFSLGATDYFTKPVNEALLLRRVGSLAGVGV